MARATIHDAAITFRCAPAVREAIQEAAGQTLMSPSHYVRSAVLDRLRAEGRAPAGMARKATRARAPR